MSSAIMQYNGELQVTLLMYTPEERAREMVERDPSLHFFFITTDLTESDTDLEDDCNDVENSGHNVFADPQQHQDLHFKELIHEVLDEREKAALEKSLERIRRIHELDVPLYHLGDRNPVGPIYYHTSTSVDHPNPILRFFKRVPKTRR